jgi:hypothetical protein
MVAAYEHLALQLALAEQRALMGTAPLEHAELAADPHGDEFVITRGQRMGSGVAEIGDATGLRPPRRTSCVWHRANATSPRRSR